MNILLKLSQDILKFGNVFLTLHPTLEHLIFLIASNKNVCDTEKHLPFTSADE